MVGVYALLMSPAQADTATEAFLGAMHDAGYTQVEDGILLQAGQYFCNHPNGNSYDQFVADLVQHRVDPSWSGTFASHAMGSAWGKLCPTIEFREYVVVAEDTAMVAEPDSYQVVVYVQAGERLFLTQNRGYWGTVAIRNQQTGEFLRTGWIHLSKLRLQN